MSRKLIENNEIDEDAKGQNVEALKKSRAIRAKFLAEFGEVPQSILVACRQSMKNVRDYVIDDMGGGSHYQKRKAKRLNSVIPGLAKTPMRLRGRKAPDTLSIFPQNIGKIITKIYCPDDGIVYDPFAGHNSRMQLVFETGRSYVGVDVSEKFMDANEKVRDYLINKQKRSLTNKDNFIKLIRGSSAAVDLPDNYADFTITSPPYWNIEYYGDEKEQLGNAKSYRLFLRYLRRHVDESGRILKSGGYACWFINDFRKNGQFYPYHVDLFRLLRRVEGFVPFNTYVVDLGHPINAAFVQDILKHKILPKRHEYCLVFRKE